MLDVASSASREPDPLYARADALSLVILDYSGHPCQVQLSRMLARRGHCVTHLHCPGYTSGKGDLELHDGDPPTLCIRAVQERRNVARYRIRARLRHEVRFASQALRAVTANDPDVVIVSNVPLLALWLFVLGMRIRRIPYVFWQQDVYSRAMTVAAESRLGRVGALIGRICQRLEAQVSRGAARIIAISDAFLPTLSAWGVTPDHVAVIENWAPLAEMPLRPRRNSWAVDHDLENRPVVLYAGTLGLKHDPAQLLDIALTMSQRMPQARMVVVSEGQGRQWLEAQAGDLEQLVLLDYQPYEALPDVLGSADVLMCLLEPEAGAYSVPSKILNCMCAGRPIVGVLPMANGAARMIKEAEAGVVFDRHSESVISRVLGLLNDAAERACLGRNARQYAEVKFDASAVTDKFESVLVTIKQIRSDGKGNCDIQHR